MGSKLVARCCTVQAFVCSINLPALHRVPAIPDIPLCVLAGMTEDPRPAESSFGGWCSTLQATQLEYARGMSSSSWMAYESLGWTIRSDSEGERATEFGQPGLTSGALAAAYLQALRDFLLGPEGSTVHPSGNLPLPARRRARCLSSHLWLPSHHLAVCVFSRPGVLGHRSGWSRRHELPSCSRLRKPRVDDSGRRGMQPIRVGSGAMPRRLGFGGLGRNATDRRG